MEQPEQSLTNVLARLEDGQLSDLDRQQLLIRYQANPVGGRNAQHDASSIDASIRWLQKLRARECEQALERIVLPGVEGPVLAAIDTRIKHEMIAFWLATQSSTRKDKEVLQQASHLLKYDKLALIELTRWFLEAYNQENKLDCIAKNENPDTTDLITERYKHLIGKLFRFLSGLPFGKEASRSR